MKRIMAMMLTVVLVMGTLAGCGNSGQSSAGADTAGGDGTAAEEEGGEEQEGVAENIEAAELDTNRTSTANAEGRYDKIAIGVNADFEDLSPWNASHSIKAYIYWMIYEPLFDFDGYDYVGVLAKDWEEIDDYHWEVHLYDNIYDSDGNHFTASDVVFSHQLTLDSGFAQKYTMLESVEAIDDTTVLYTWNELIDSVAELEWPWTNTCMVTEAAYNSHNFASDPVGTGPYTVSEVVTGSKVVLEANDDYWQSDDLVDLSRRRNVQTIEYDVITESAQHVIALQNGTIDFSYSVPSENLDDFMGDDAFTVDRQLSTGCYNIILNRSEGKFGNDLNFRLACFYAIDNEAVAAVSDTSASKAVGSPAFSDYNAEWEKIENYTNTCDLELAKEYLDKTAYSGETLILVAPNTEIYKNIATMIQSQLLQIGVNVELSLCDETQSNALLNTNDYDFNVGVFGGQSQIAAFNRFCNNQDFEDGLPMGHNPDSQLTEIFLDTYTIENHTEEGMTKLVQYMYDTATICSLSNSYKTYVYNSDIASITYDPNAQKLMFGGFDYYLD